ncbi:MAG: pyridoxal-phosphate dependent enzyme [Sulfurimonas sp.]
MPKSPLSKITLEGRDFLVKRDDLIDPYLAGNKYRKLYKLLNTPKSKYRQIISYGGTQSNAMLAIAAMCKEKTWEFVYYTKPISKVIREQTYGNYFHAVNLGMKHREIDIELYRDYIATLSINYDEDSYIIDQGGADTSALDGLEVLAQEIKDQTKDLDIKSLATPSGTGTTALFLARALPEYIVYTTPCVGDRKYLMEQMSALAEIPKNLIILEAKKKYHFAKLYPEFLEIYKKTKEAGIVFDLLYAPAMWLALLEQTSQKVLYIHSGGVSGNESMLKRYSQKFSQ